MNSAYIVIVGVVVVCCLAQENQKTSRGLSASTVNRQKHRLFKRGSPRFWNTFGRLPWKRSKLDNHINNIPDYPPKASEDDMGDAIIDEFMIFLALKESGILDICLNTASSIFQ